MIAGHNQMVIGHNEMIIGHNEMVISHNEMIIDHNEMVIGHNEVTLKSFHLETFIPISTHSFSMAKACFSVVLRVEK
jgi:hypothetical protein